MARRKAKKGGSKGKAPARKRPAARKKPARAATARKADAGAASKRIATLEAENRRLRAEVETLRSERTAPAPDETRADSTPALQL
jgi:hypothetical protein